MHTARPCQQMVKSRPRLHPAKQQPRRCVRSIREAATKLPFKHVCVIGAGVVGLSSAVRLLQEIPDIKVTLVAEKFGRDTTTAGAAGIWGPYALGDVPEDVLHKWSKDTFDFLVSLSYGPEAAQTGTYMVSGWQLYDSPEPLPFWYDIVHNFSSVPPSQLQHFSPSVKAAQFYTSVMCEGRHFLAWLTKRLEDLGGAVVQGRVSRLSQLYSDFDVVVNCSGLQARELANDELVHPIRGQIVRVQAPWVKHFYFSNPYYIIPNRDWVVLGGTAQAGDSNPCVNLEDRKRVLQGCSRVLPSLEDAVVLDEWVGLRPGRKTLRLESEMASFEGKELLVVHNYGHGGSGLTLGWGCAGDVVGLVRTHLGR